ncbi:MAG: pilus assembly protein TadG-related protein [Salinisphaeraceae bacterium]
MPNRLPQLRGCPARPGRQRGATLVFTAFTLVALVATLGLAVDVGRLYATQTQLQRTAEVAALDAARTIGGCRVGEPDAPQTAAELAVQNAIGNQADDDGAPAITPEVLLGIQESDGSLLSFAASDAFDADSVQVTLTRPAPTPLVAFFTADRPLTASATAISRPQAGISVGTSLARIGGLDGSEGILAALLGTNQVNLVSYEGLADAQLTIGDLLQADATITGVEDLLQTDFTLPESLGFLADTLDATTGSANALAAATLRDLADLADPGRSSQLGQILNIEEGFEDLAASLPLNALDLLTGLAQAANLGSPVDLPVGVDLGGIATVDGQVNIIEPPQIAFGRAGLDGSNQPRTRATTAQAAIQLNVTVLDVLPGLLGGPFLNLPIYIKVASAEATLDDIQCAGQTPLAENDGTFQHFIEVGTTTRIADLGIGEFADIGAFDPQPPAPGQDITILNIAGVAQVTAENAPRVSVGAPDSEAVEFVGPFPPQDEAEIQTETVGPDLSDSLNGALSGLSDDLLANLDVDLFNAGALGDIFEALDGLVGGLIGGLLDGILDGLLGGLLGLGNPDSGDLLDLVTGILEPILDTLDDTLLEPLFNLLGLSAGAADVSVQSVLINQPAIYCTDRQCNAE